MKKALALATAIAASFALTACHPPHEQPTNEKVRTATKVAAPTVKVTSTKEATADADQVGMPKFANCHNTPVNLPHMISLDCEKNSKVLKDILWSKVTQKRAVGIGVLHKGEALIDNTKVELSDPEETSQGLVYTIVKINGHIVPTN